jgi:RNA polymerase sigma-70 factor, ECF subfamily
VQRDLVEAAQRGDHEAFEVLAVAAGDRLFTIARLVLRDTHLAEDAVQDALVHAWRNLPTLREPERWDAWLHRLVVNACADQGRRKQRRVAEVRMVRIEPATDDRSRSIDDHDQLDRGFRRLKPDQRAAVVLHFYLGLTVPEVADALGVPLGTAKSRIHYAVEALRAALEADERTPIATTGGLA